MYTRMVPILVVSLVFLVLVPVSEALDTGLLQHYLNLDVKLPQPERCVSSSAVLEAARAHLADVSRNAAEANGPLALYWHDYAAVLSGWSELSKPLPVYVKDSEKPLVARWLVGLVKNGRVGGFMAFDSKDASLLSPLMWKPSLEPLWIVPLSDWESAEKVNDIEALSDLIPPYAQFTTGIPVDPSRFHLVDGVTGLPYKTQEERLEFVEEFNRTKGVELGVTLHHTPGRRTATSKCLTVAASYIADWWTVRTGHELPWYVNAVGGQKEYGFNPRLLECIYFKRARSEASIAGRAVIGLGDLTGVGIYALSQFKMVGRDRVTGEPIPYSPRGYARVLCETGKGEYPDALVPALLTYKTVDNNFSMDQKPLPIVLDRNFTALITDMRDERRAGKDNPFSLSPWHGQDLSLDERADVLCRALDTWGPLLAQHMKRNSKGNPSAGLMATGVHAVVLVGYGDYEGRTHFVYRETFGNCAPGYLEDSFIGPSYRIMPVEYFYQAIAFPHHLYLDLSWSYGPDAALVGILHVKTNRKTDVVDVDEVTVLIADKISDVARVKHLAPGEYRIWIPAGFTRGASTIEVRVDKRYFADAAGKKNFSIFTRRDGRKWRVEK